MNKKVLLPASIVIVLVIAAGFLAARKGAEHPGESSVSSGSQSAQMEQELNGGTTPVASPTTTATPSPKLTPTPGQTTGQFSSGEDMGEGVDVQVFEIAYDGTAYTPANLTVKAGDIVIFKNNSKEDFWPASNPHPLHTDFSAFDPRKPIPAGGEFDFKFTKVGTWKFHDHLNPVARGSIVVTQ
jgi:plastocyanin